MDPDRTLERLRSLARRIDDLDQGDAIEAVEAFAALDDWIRRGGTLPSAWQR